MKSTPKKRLFRFVLPTLAAALVAPLPQAASAENASWRESGGFLAPIRDEIADRAGKNLKAFYAARGYAPLWLNEFGRPSGAATLLWLRMRTADRDGVDPGALDIDKLAKALDRARAGDRKDVARAELALSNAFVEYVRAMRAAPHAEMLYESAALQPSVPDPRAVLEAAGRAPSLENYIDDMGWMNPLYAPLRKAIDDPRLSEVQRRRVAANLARVRAIPAMPQGRAILVDTASARLWMYEDGRAVDTMKVVVGKPELQTPMMAGYVRYAIENPYWEVPPDLVQNTIATNVLDYGIGYLKDRGYQVLANWSDDAPLLDPASIDWRAIHDGLFKVHVRQLPGGDNFMGKVKFEFPNPQGIYLHDTPDKHLMKLDARQLSSGCVRMEDAARMHRWLMGKPIPARAPAEQQLDLPQPVPIYITYLTALPTEGGIAFHGDPYGRDGFQLASAK